MTSHQSMARRIVPVFALHTAMTKRYKPSRCPRKDRIDAATVSDAIDYAKFRSRSHRAVIRVNDEAGNVIETHEQVGEFREQKRC